MHDHKKEVLSLHCLSVVSDQAKQLKKSEVGLKKVEKDRDQLNDAIDKLRDNLAKTEKQKKDLMHEVSIYFANFSMKYNWKETLQPL